MSASIGKGLRLHSHPDLTVSANLYILAGAESGAGKSLVFNPTLDPFLDFEPARGAKDVLAGRASRLWCEDTTGEGLARLLMSNSECIASISADARDVIDVVRGRYRDRGRTDEGLLLKAYSGILTFAIVPGGRRRSTFDIRS